MFTTKTGNVILSEAKDLTCHTEILSEAKDDRSIPVLIGNIHQVRHPASTAPALLVAARLVFLVMKWLAGRPAGSLRGRFLEKTCSSVHRGGGGFSGVGGK